MIASRYADPTIAYREADQTLAALFTALQPVAATRLQAVEKEFGGLLAQLAQESGEKYSALLRGEEGFERFFRAATPVSELAGMNLGSRPAVRGAAKASSGGNGLVGLRAIPWVFA